MIHLIPIAAAAAKDTALMTKAINAATILGGLAALGAVVTFAWAKLRIDKLWGWVFKHIQEDKKAARQKEIMEVWTDPKMIATRTHDIAAVIASEVTPHLEAINKRIDDHMIREEAAAVENNHHVEEISSSLKKISVEQARVAKELLASQEVVHQHLTDDDEFKARVEPYLGNIDSVVEQTVAKTKQNTQSMGQEILDAIRDMRSQDAPPPSQAV